jgi:hypothetical protein
MLFRMFSKPMNLPQIETLVIGEQYTARERLKARTLMEINALRRTLGMGNLDQLPKGKMKDSNGCVIYNALQPKKMEKPRMFVTSVGMSDIKFETVDPYDWPIPMAHTDTIRKFVIAFDNGMYPELIGR